MAWQKKNAGPIFWRSTPTGRVNGFMLRAFATLWAWDWAPGTNTLWTAVNERDGLGDNLVPDYITSVEEGGFYGWPYAYFGDHADPRLEGKAPELVEKTIVPDVAVGPHTASLGLAFYDKEAFPANTREVLL